MWHKANSQPLLSRRQHPPSHIDLFPGDWETTARQCIQDGEAAKPGPLTCSTARCKVSAPPFIGAVVVSGRLTDERTELGKRYAMQRSYSSSRITGCLS